MARGTVKRFSEEKGYGFIAPDEGGGDLFVHYLAIEGRGFRSLEEGERVSYEPARGRKGEEAKDVRRIPLQDSRYKLLGSLVGRGGY